MFAYSKIQIPWFKGTEYTWLFLLQFLQGRQFFCDFLFGFLKTPSGHMTLIQRRLNVDATLHRR